MSTKARKREIRRLKKLYGRKNWHAHDTKNPYRRRMRPLFWALWMSAISEENRHVVLSSSRARVPSSSWRTRAEQVAGIGYQALRPFRGCRSPRSFRSGEARTEQVAG